MACVESARAGHLIAELPPAVDDFTVDKTDTGVIAHRPGRTLREDEGKALWDLFSREYFPRGGLASGSSGLYSTDKCPSVSKASCFHLQWWACQTSLVALLGWMREAASQIGAGDAELEIVLSPLERRGPTCKDGPECRPTAHYSKATAIYDPSGARIPSDLGGSGECKDDGDCDGGGNACEAWYLSGGAELDIYIQVARPTFCGCVSGECAWFTQ
jgi:hypothetical protein